MSGPLSSETLRPARTKPFSRILSALVGPWEGGLFATLEEVREKENDVRNPSISFIVCVSGISALECHATEEALGPCESASREA